jgi:lysozyme family protein
MKAASLSATPNRAVPAIAASPSSGSRRGGISRSGRRAHLRRPEEPAAADADALYGKFFMDPCHFDDLPLGVDYVVLDGFINGGGLIILQHALGMKDDHPEVEHHIFGPVTLWGATHRDPRVFINKLCDVRRARNAVLRLSNKPIKTGSQKTWEQVWNERTEVVRKRALAMVK